MQPTRATSRNVAPMPPLFGLAPGGVYRAACRCRRRGALLPHPFDLADPKTGGILSVALSLTPDQVRGRRALPGTVVPWSPDFPRPLARAPAARPPGPAYVATPFPDRKRVG